MNQIFDVVIVGAGIAGVATAYYLSTHHGITNILLVDKRPPMTHTSDKSGSNYRNWWSHPAMAQLANHSIDLMDDLAGKTHNIFHMNRRGYAYFSRNDDIESYLKPYMQAGVGEIRIHRDTSNSYQPDENPTLSGADVLIGNALIKQVAPFVADDIQSMVHVRRAGWISTRVMAQHMLDIAAQNGLVEMRGAVTRVEATDNTSTLTIETPYDEQTVDTRQVLFAVGPNLPQIATILDLEFPLQNVFHQKVMLQDNGQVLPDGMPFMIFTDSPSCDWTEAELAYLRKHTQSEHIPGNFHIRRVNPDWIHLGWAFNNQPARNIEQAYFERLYPQAVIKGLSSFIPALESYTASIPQPTLVSGGFYTRTPENLPILQQVQSGVYIIGALSGFGVMMGCGVGEIMSRMMAGQDVPNYVQHFSASRYNDPAYVKQIESMPSGEL
jgi:glycine/D-amino acid oxidase-like deaminating enzyme